ncbi:MAG: hypothetical protein EOP53_07670 [Sphingobacteriales bacterium]|nr:MAG: hypothetical protein EOP53_07670 [Sphingobacteriales bacterium]
MIHPVVIVLPVFALVIVTNIWIHKWMVHKALKYYVIPFLIDKNLVYIDYEWTGFFSTGDFNFDEEFHSVRMFPWFRYIYLNIHFKNGNKQKYVTVKIKTSFLSVRQVTYSRDIKNASV